MSKIDAQRAMWRQRYERQQAAAAARPASAPSASGRPPVAPPVSASAPVERPERAGAEVTERQTSEPVEEPCGHRNMGGRTCTRERGHSAKSHRYS